MESYHNAMTGKYERVVARAPRARSAARRRHRRRHARGVRRRRARTSILSRALRDGDRSAARPRRAGARPAQPPRLRDGGLLPPVRRHARLSELQRVAGRPRRRARRGARAATTATTRRACRRRVRCAPARISSRPASAPSASKRKCSALVPGARVARLDRDAIRRNGALDALLARFRDGEIDVLVGTQMIAKGHDFPRVTLVGVISADVGLGLADFRGMTTFPRVADIIRKLTGVLQLPIGLFSEELRRSIQSRFRSSAKPVHRAYSSRTRARSGRSARLIFPGSFILPLLFEWSVFSGSMRHL